MKFFKKINDIIFDFLNLNIQLDISFKSIIIFIWFIVLTISQTFTITFLSILTYIILKKI